MIVKTSKESKNRKRTLEAEVQKRNASLFITIPHVNGLPIPEDTNCTIYSTPDKYEIESSGNSFELDKSKVTDVCVKTETEVTSQYVSSVGGAIGGAVLFGPLGAAIGGRAKKKKTKEVHEYLIFTYESNGEIKYIGFQVLPMHKLKTFYFVDEFNKMENKHISKTVL